MPDTKLCVTSKSNGSPLTMVQAGQFSITIDEPKVFGGNNSAPSPIMYMLASIAGCIHAAGHIAAKDMRFSMGEVSVSVEGVTNSDRFFMKETNDRSGFASLDVSIEIETKEPQQRIDEWLNQVRYRCPVTDNIEFTTPVSYSCLTRVR